ncbi:MAG: Multifunctional non-homologous end joining protein LigD [Wolbachia endosymbiont of Ctenocephalides orientis wCori]|nr:MAG: Multifunctional non-homologous end joining protein LigD [Wolbachia endosymbiont of Ctenocephalides orientis wCori]
MELIKIDNKTISVTHAEKVLFPESNITKSYLIKYYMAIADRMLPYIKNRPLTIHCFPNGIAEEGFYRSISWKTLLIGSKRAN